MDQERVATESTSERAGSAVEESVRLMARLRAPDGCPWDREQTFDSIMRHTLEETYEVFDAIERRAWPELRDELGDLLLQILFYAQMAEEAGHFSLTDVADALNAKLIRRHPHIFGDATARSAEEVTQTWEAVKRRERQAKGEPALAGLLDGVPRHQPALTEARKLGAKAAEVGFDWPDATGLLEKLAEETRELEAELGTGQPERVQEEFGDLLFTVVNLGRHLRVDPEFALRAANAKFRKRFSGMEAEAGSSEALRGRKPEELEALWAKAKDL